MTAEEVPIKTGSEPPRAGWRDWLQVAAIAALLLVLSQALWIWQTWPVRDLLQPTPTPTRPAGAR
ncbi:MAG TPA: hypothetical protein VHL79_07265 [Ramlibacter sp.]|jgi:hypothetical protein|nr:hypothetical protein [Ramlibacter sp.]